MRIKIGRPNEKNCDLKFLNQETSVPSYVSTTAWLRHGPFAIWLVKALRPNKIVELGSHYGFSYFSFCQAVKEAELATTCFAVDTWQGDEHAGFYSEVVFAAVEAENEKYRDFSTLLRKTFSEALDDIPDGSVDLLHIDGRHRYSDVKEDFESWIPKLSKDAIVLFHDTEVRRDDFGVWQYWAELESQYTTFNFPFQHGLGVLLFGGDPTQEIAELRRLAATETGRNTLFALFYAQSEVLPMEAKIKELEGINAANSRVTNELKRVFNEELGSTKEMLVRLAAGNKELRREIAAVRSNPYTVFKDRIVHNFLTGLAAGSLPIGERKRQRFQNSAAKRDPRRSLGGEIAELEAYVHENDPVSVNAADRHAGSKVYSAALDAVISERRVGFSAAMEKFSLLSREIAAKGEGIDASMLPGFLVKKSSFSVQGPVAIPARSNDDPNIPSGLTIYTALFGNFDQLPALYTEDQGIDFVCFTDQEISAPGWRIERRDPPHADPNLAAKYFKLMPHELFPDRECSIFVDANTLFLGRLDSVIATYLKPYDFVMWRHPERDDIVDEAEAVILHNKDDPETVCRQMAKYEKAGFPRNAGLYECSFIWRKHHNPEVKSLMEAWWQEVTNHSKRDQISFYFLAHTRGPKPCVLPRSLGTSRKNVLFSKLPHQAQNPRNKVRNKFKPKQRPKVTFLFDKASESFGSTFLRSLQLPSLLKQQLEDSADISFTTDIGSVRESFIVVGKRMMDGITKEEIHNLRRHNIAIAADPVDAVVDNETTADYDMLLAASLMGLEKIRQSSPSTPSFLLTHHADLRIEANSPPNDKLRVGYFGELQNTVGSASLGHLVDYNSISTSTMKDGWLEKLADYNTHFAVRNVREIDGFKPFTKGFVAAKCGAVIICERDVGDNKFYLGDDYPYYVPNTGLDEIERFLFELPSEFGSASWKYAQKIMGSVRHRSSAEWIAKEFRIILAEVWD